MKRRLLLLLAAAALICFCSAEPDTVETSAAAKRCVALTFDDGPWPGTTEKLLDGLRQRGVRATFFLIGAQIAGLSDVVEQMAADGHQIGNHTYSHVRLDQLPTEEGLAEIEKTDALLTELLGAGEHWIRPPWGFISDALRETVTVPLVYWSVDPEDWRRLDKEAVACCILDTVPDGDIILLHDPYDSSVEATFAVVDALLAEGVEFVTVEELFALSGEEPEPGRLYERPGHTR